MAGWSDKELKVLNETEIFHLKPNIIKKAESSLTKLKDSLIMEISKKNLNLPPGTDTSKGQIARGENHNGFPFISMDMPQKFSKEDMFTYRTLFWWGHYLIFSFILKGQALPLWLLNIVTRKAQAENIYFSLSPAPWEWQLNKQNYRPLATADNDEIETIVRKNQYIKLARFHPVSHPEFQNLDWMRQGVETFWTITGLFL